MRKLCLCFAGVGALLQHDKFHLVQLWMDRDDWCWIKLCCCWCCYWMFLPSTFPPSFYRLWL